MKNVTYKLKTPIDGVKELVLNAPTRKQLKFAAAVKSSFMSVAIEMTEKLGEKVSPDKAKKGGEEDVKISGNEMLMTMYGGSIDTGDLIDRFISACTSSPMCQMNGGEVPESFWEGVTMEDMEGLFAEFIENFITI